MIIEKETHAEFYIDTKTIGTSAEQLTENHFNVRKHVKVQAHEDNTDFVYVGHNSGVGSTYGWRLDAGEHVDIAIDDPTKIWIVGGAADQVAKFLCL